MQIEKPLFLKGSCLRVVIHVKVLNDCALHNQWKNPIIDNIFLECYKLAEIPH